MKRILMLFGLAITMQFIGAIYADTIVVRLGGNSVLRFENAKDMGQFYEAEFGGKNVKVNKKEVVKVLKDSAPIVVEKYPTARYPINYAIVVSKKTSEDENWKKVISALHKKYKAEIFEYEGDSPAAIMKDIVNYTPKYVCFVAQPLEANYDYVRTANEIMRKLDNDPYFDAIWSILTGYDHNDALRMINAPKLTLTTAVSHVGSGWLDAFNEGVSYSESEAKTMFVKEKGKGVEKKTCEQDTIKPLVDLLNSGKYHIFSTSGHATEGDWQAGYSYKNGQVRCGPEGKLFGLDLAGKKFDIKSDNAKIYYSPGNCLIAHISNKDCMALSWIHSGGVNQFFGHIEPQYRICRAWGIGDYFFTLQDRYTYAESFYLNNQSTIYTIEQENPTPENKSFFTRCYNNTILYGDPAWEARMARAKNPAYDQELSVKKKSGVVKLTFTIKANEDCGFGRPPIAMLPFNITEGKVVNSTAGNVVVLDNLIILNPLKAGETVLKKGELRTVEIEAKAADVLKKKPSRTK